MVSAKVVFGRFATAHDPRHSKTAARVSGRFAVGAGDEIRTHDPNLGKVMLYP
ncbi:MAG: hypothetical protein JWS11_3259 [Cypionkella sp.]|nr:hypothetical protein [Cypionkella sp.]